VTKAFGFVLWSPLQSIQAENRTQDSTQAKHLEMSLLIFLSVLGLRQKPEEKGEEDHIFYEENAVLFLET
jgi:hypothetical protein